MHIEALGQHLQIASREEAVTLTQLDRQFWNVVSITGLSEAHVQLVSPMRVHHAVFDDVEDYQSGPDLHAATFEDIAQIFEFADSIDRGPLLIHCRHGMSRSPALALALICRRLAARENFTDGAVDILLTVRPKARPNLLVLRLGLAQFLPMPEAARLTLELANHPRLLANRSGPQ